MKFKELLLPMSLALITTFAFQYFFTPNKTDSLDNEVKSGERFTAPKITEEVHKPLNTEVDFIDGAYKKTILTEVKTNHARYQFSNEGASLNHVEFKRNWAGKEGYLSTVFAPTSVDKEKRCFLVAFNEKTPYYFDFISQEETSDAFILNYSVEVEGGILKKQFTVYKNEFKIDLDLSLVLQTDATTDLQMRIFYGSPIVPELGKEDVISAVVNDGPTNVQIYPKNQDILNQYWAKPTLMGTQDRYFVHALVNDSNNFVQRGYFTVFNLENLYTILEGPVVNKSQSWKMSFYFGPKTDHALLAVDERLTQVLSYGKLAFITRPVSRIMLDILNLFYDFLHNYGLAIILLTLLMKLVLLPFTFRAEQSMRDRGDIKKKLDHLQSKYKHDKEALAQARAEFLRKNGPGLGSCLPLLMQIPLFFALSWVLSNSIELYKAPFLWIGDLSAADPYYLLPIAVAISMLFQNPIRGDSSQLLTSAMIGLVFAAFTASLPAGLTLYILVSTLLGIAQSLIAKRIKYAK